MAKMTLAHIADKVLNQPLLLTDTKAAIIVNILAERMGIEDIEDSEAGSIEPQASRFVGSPRMGPNGTSAGYSIKDNVAIIPIIGTMVNRGAWIGASSGLVSYEGVGASIDLALADDLVTGVVLDLNTPGGEAGGAFELAKKIKSASKQKPVIAYVNSMAASAGYAMAAGADQIVTGEGGSIGSIGVVMVHSDHTKRIEAAGIKTTVFRSKELKAIGGPHEKLTESASVELNRRISDLHNIFVSTVVSLRPEKLTVEAVENTKARVLLGQAAVDAGLADHIGDLDLAIELAKQ